MIDNYELEITNLKKQLEEREKPVEAVKVTLSKREGIRMR